VEQIDVVLLDALANEVVPSMYMLGLSVVFGIFGKSLGALVINVEGNCRAWT
jgi:hypothetical protein